MGLIQLSKLNSLRLCWPLLYVSDMDNRQEVVMKGSRWSYIAKVIHTHKYVKFQSVNNSFQYEHIHMYDVVLHHRVVTIHNQDQKWHFLHSGLLNFQKWKVKSNLFNKTEHYKQKKSTQSHHKTQLHEAVNSKSLQTKTAFQQKHAFHKNYFKN